MPSTTSPLLVQGLEPGRRLIVDPAECFSIRHALGLSVRAVGERLLTGEKGIWESGSLGGGHLWSRNDLEATGLIIRYVSEFFAKAGLLFEPSFENEEVPLLPAMRNGHRTLRLIIDPVDGSKAFDNAMSPADCPIPRPSSAVSIAAVCPTNHLIVASAIYCFDLGEVFSSVLVSSGSDSRPHYLAFRDETLLRPMAHILAGIPSIEAKRRILNCNYNSRALVEIARIDLALMDRKLKAGYGGLAGSSAMDIINVVRGSFAAALDVRALCGAAGSVLYWYDIAGAVSIAIGRGLEVLIMTADGASIEGGDREIYAPVAFVIARPDAFDKVLEAVTVALDLSLPSAHRALTAS